MLRDSRWAEVGEHRACGEELKETAPVAPGIHDITMDSRIRNPAYSKRNTLN
jgi:hypothetical protein